MDKVRLGDYISVRTGKLDANAADENGLYPFFTCSQIPLQINNYAFDCECVLIAGNGDLNVKYYNGKFNAYQRTYVITATKEINIKYLYRFFDFYIEKLRQQSIGGVIKYIKLKNLTDIKFNLYDFQTQRTIVEELDCLSDIIKKKKQQLADLDNLIKSQFIDMFGDSFSDARFELNELNSICDVRDGTHDSPKYHTTGYPLITSKNIVNGIISFENVNLICKEDYDKINQRSFVDNGDILMPMIGTIGNPVIVNKTREFAIKNVALIKFLKESKVVNHFLYYLMKSDTFNNYLQEKNKGGTQKFVSLGIIRKIKIITPPIELQNKFADFVKNIDKLKLELKQSIDETQTLFNERMQHYFGD